jgi:hypothetical protein
MGKKLDNFAQVLRMVNNLTEEQRATLRDVLRPAVVRKPAKKSSNSAPRAGRKSSSGKTEGTTSTASTLTAKDSAMTADANGIDADAH